MNETMSKSLESGDRKVRTLLLVISDVLSHVAGEAKAPLSVDEHRFCLDICRIKIQTSSAR